MSNITVSFFNKNLSNSSLIVGNIFDSWIMWLVFFLAILPFGNILHLNAGPLIIDVYEIIYILLAIILIIKIILECKLKYPLSLFFFMSITLVYIFYSVIAFDVSILDSLRQIRFYFPFIIANLLLASRISVLYEKYSKLIIIAATVSSLSALLIHYFLPGFIEYSFKSSEQITSIILSHGRLYWTNSSLVFFVLFFLFAESKKVKRIYLLLIFSISLFTVINTVSRTTILGLMLYFSIWLLLSKKISEKKRRFAVFIFILIIVATIIFVFTKIDERLTSLIKLRIFGNGDVSNIYQTDFLLSRVYMYKQYIESILNYFPIGQGLGRPFSIRGTGELIYISDISLISFAIPFGIVGALIIIGFIIRLFRIIHRLVLTVDMESVKYLNVMLIIFILMSFNIDWFTRNNFIIYFTLLLLSLQQEKNYSR